MDAKQTEALELFVKGDYRKAKLAMAESETVSAEDFKVFIDRCNKMIAVQSQKSPLAPPPPPLQSKKLMPQHCCESSKHSATSSLGRVVKIVGGIIVFAVIIMVIIYMINGVRGGVPHEDNYATDSISEVESPIQLEEEVNEDAENLYSDTPDDEEDKFDYDEFEIN